MIRLTNRIPAGVPLWAQVIECLAIAAGLMLDSPFGWTAAALLAIEPAYRWDEMEGHHETPAEHDHDPHFNGPGD